jgi:hypothetical protein
MTMPKNRTDLIGELLDLGASTAEMRTMLDELHVQRTLEADLSLYCWRRANALLTDPDTQHEGRHWLAAFRSFQVVNGYPAHPA